MKAKSNSWLVFLLVIFVPGVIAATNFDSSGEFGDASGAEGAKAADAVRDGKDYSGSLSSPVTVNGMTISGNVEIVGGKVIRADTITYGGNDIRDVENFNPTGNGGFTASHIGSFSGGGITLTNGNGVTFSNGLLHADSADTFVQGSMIASDVNDLDSSEVSVAGSNSQYSIAVGSADRIQHGCVELRNVMGATLSPGAGLGVYSEIGIPFTITDCSYQESTFEPHMGGGTIRVSQDSARPAYEIEKGTLTCKGAQSNDVLEANESATLNYGTQCFECMGIFPRGSYFYNDLAAIEKDFIITIPSDSPRSPYSLCLRRNPAQFYAGVDGVADFVEGAVSLSGIAQYKRYPIIGNQVTALLTAPVYEGKSEGLVGLFRYLPDFTFLRGIFIRGVKNNTVAGEVAKTTPSNYMTISEEKAADGKTHSVIRIDWDKKKEDLTTPIADSYETDDGLPPLIIEDDNTATQDNGENRLTILPPDDPRIGTLLA